MKLFGKPKDAIHTATQIVKTAWGEEGKDPMVFNSLNN